MRSVRPGRTLAEFGGHSPSILMRRKSDGRSSGFFSSGALAASTAGAPLPASPSSREPLRETSPRPRRDPPSVQRSARRRGGASSASIPSASLVTPHGIFSAPVSVIRTMSSIRIPNPSSTR